MYFKCVYLDSCFPICQVVVVRLPHSACIIYFSAKHERGYIFSHKIDRQVHAIRRLLRQFSYSVCSVPRSYPTIVPGIGIRNRNINGAHVLDSPTHRLASVGIFCNPLCLRGSKYTYLVKRCYNSILQQSAENSEVGFQFTPSSFSFS